MARRHTGDGAAPVQLELPLELHQPREPSMRRRAVELGRLAGVALLRVVLAAAGAGAVLAAFPYRTTVDGIPLRIEISMLSRHGLSIDTTLGNWLFDDVDRLPVGVHVSPQNLDLLTLAKSAHPDTDAFVSQLRTDVRAELPTFLAVTGLKVVAGTVLGLVVAAGALMAVRYLRGQPRLRRSRRERVRQVAVGAVVVLVVAAFGALTYNPHWVKRSRLTGTLAAAQLFPDQLQQYYQQSKAAAVVGSVIGIQDALQNQVETSNAPPTALRIMLISDVHLAAVYPVIGAYARAYGVDLILDTGDESEFGSAAEMTPSFRAALAAVTKAIPMLWVSGNHDSPEVSAIMARMPNVTVLGTKTRKADGSIAVAAGQVDAFGLHIAAMPDPRVYGALAPYGSDDNAIVLPLERKAITSSLADVDSSARFDIFATHNPVAAEAARSTLPRGLRQTDAGDVHVQNVGKEQRDGHIDIIEGSTGAGGLDHIGDETEPQPISFSIESVAANCQFTKLLRFQIAGPQPAAAPTQPGSYGTDVTSSTVYFRPQDVQAGRVCAPVLGVGRASPL